MEGMKGDLAEKRRSLAADRVLAAKLAESDGSGLGATQEEHGRGTVWPFTKRSSPGMITMCWSSSRQLSGSHQYTEVTASTQRRPERVVDGRSTKDDQR